MTKFSDFPLDTKLLQALDKMGFTEPTPIQAQTLELVVKGHDVIGLAETGSGKTAACAIPVCQRVDTTRGEIQALIVVPTRELALQYAVETQRIGGLKGVKAFALFGGEDFDLQHAKLKAGVHVLVATPGRLIDLVYGRYIDLSHVNTLILDEADEMLSMGFYDDVEFIIDCLVQTHQTLLFSATMPKAVTDLAKKHMREPKEIVLTKSKTGPSKIEHLFVYCPQLSERPRRILELLEDTRPRQALIFGGARHQVEKLSSALRSKLQQVDYLHGGLGQDVRRIITNKFRTGKVRYLVATDIASRGLDFSGVTHVFNFQLPREADVYVHRSGRTGRSGREGIAISLVGARDLGLLDQILEKIKREPRWIGTEPPKKGVRSASPRGGHRERQGPPKEKREARSVSLKEGHQDRPESSEKGIQMRTVSPDRAPQKRRGPSSDGPRERRGPSSDGSRERRGPSSDGPRERRGPSSDGPRERRGPSSDGSRGRRGPSSDGPRGRRGPSSDGPRERRGPSSDGPRERRGPSSDGPRERRGPSSDGPRGRGGPPTGRSGGRPSSPKGGPRGRGGPPTGRPGRRPSSPKGGPRGRGGAPRQKRS